MVAILKIAFGSLLLTSQIDVMVWSLTPKRLPNGQPRKFVPDLHAPRNDLHLISPGTVNLISKNWMQNIILDVVTRKQSDNNNNNEFIYDDIHIVCALQHIQQLIETNQKKLSNTWPDMVNVGSIDTSPYIFLAWKPKSLQGINEVLFIVAACLSVIKDENNFDIHYFDIQNVVQSPYWDESQIDSIHLKYALIDQNNYTNQTILRLESLYNNNIRYKLSWETWLQKSEIDR